MADSSRFTGKVTLVTGAGSGIGRASALAFAREGAAVVLAGRREEPLRVVAAEIAAKGGRAITVPADVSDQKAVEALVHRATDQFGGLDVAFNNAGETGAFGPLADGDLADFESVVATNLRGVWLLMKYEIRAMQVQGRGGAIVNTSSIAATGGTAGLSAYAASKGALDAMIRPVALEVGPQGIRVNNVSPGVTGETGMTGAMPDEYKKLIGDHSALKRLGKPEEIASAALWLASDAASYMTGQSIVVDGGFNIAGQR